MEFINEWFWFFLLLPIAAVSGWVIGRRGGERHSDSQVSKLDKARENARLFAEEMVHRVPLRRRIPARPRAA